MLWHLIRMLNKTVYGFMEESEIIPGLFLFKKKKKEKERKKTSQAANSVKIICKLQHRDGLICRC